MADEGTKPKSKPKSKTKTKPKPKPSTNGFDALEELQPQPQPPQPQLPQLSQQQLNQFMQMMNQFIQVQPAQPQPAQPIVYQQVTRQPAAFEDEKEDNEDEAEEAEEDEEAEDDVGKSAPSTPKDQGVDCTTSDLFKKLNALMDKADTIQQSFTEILLEVEAHKPDDDDVRAYRVSDQKLSLSSENASLEAKRKVIEDSTRLAGDRIASIHAEWRKAVQYMIKVVRYKNSIAARDAEPGRVVKKIGRLSISGKK
jgi:hypothetical protein